MKTTSEVLSDFARSSIVLGNQQIELGGQIPAVNRDIENLNAQLRPIAQQPAAAPSSTPLWAAIVLSFLIAIVFVGIVVFVVMKGEDIPVTALVGSGGVLVLLQGIALVFAHTYSKNVTHHHELLKEAQKANFTYNLLEMLKSQSMSAEEKAEFFRLVFKGAEIS